MGNEALVPKLTSLWDTPTRKENVKTFLFIVFLSLVGISAICGFAFIADKDKKEAENYVPEITIQSIDFTVINLTETRLSVRWDLLIRIPEDLPGYFMCLKGNFQVFILYQGDIIANSSIESYNLIPCWAQQLNVSSIASEGDMDGAIVKDIMEDIKKRGEIRFGSRVILPDCRYGTSGKMEYACDEAMLRFEPGSQRKATAFGNQPTCVYVR